MQHVTPEERKISKSSPSSLMLHNISVTDSLAEIALIAISLLYKDARSSHCRYIMHSELQV